MRSAIVLFLTCAFVVAAKLASGDRPTPITYTLPTGAFADIDSFLARHPLAPPETLRVTPLGQGAHSTAILIQLAPHARVPGHVHRTHDETVHVLRGSGRMRLGPAVHALRAGQIVILPAGTPHGAMAGSDGCAVVSVYAPVWDPADRHRDPRGDP